MLHELAKNPTVQERVFEEIVSVMGERELITFEDLQKMTLVRGCIRETLRYANYLWYRSMASLPYLGITEGHYLSVTMVTPIT